LSTQIEPPTATGATGPTPAAETRTEAAAPAQLADQPGVYTTKLGRFGLLTLLGALSWAIPSANYGTLSQSLFATMDPVHKVKMVAILATVSSIGGSLAVIVGGLLSDRTRSVYGKRKPWLLAGSLLAAGSMGAVWFTTSFPLLVVEFTVSQIGLNIMVAALSALLPDRVGKALLGRASALAGLGNLLGGAIGGVIASGFLPTPKLGLVIVPWTMVAAAVAICLLLPTISSQDAPVERLVGRRLLRQLAPPADRDFWLVFGGRVLFLLGLLTTFAYQLYILTDHFGADAAVAQSMIALSGVILALGAGVFTVVMGPVSDKVKRRKPFVIGAGVVGAAGVSLLLTSHNVAVFPISIAALSVAYGTFISVDQALMVEVLPDQANAARDLGFLTVANSAPGVLAPGLAGLLVGIGGYPAVFAGGLAMTLISGVFLFFVRRVR
jgi:MFS family permease